MISVQDAIKTILSLLPERKEELRKVHDSKGYVLAEDVFSEFSSPMFDNSAMDGYAISKEDTETLLKDFQNQEFRVIGISQAGKPFLESLSEGTSVQINTGAKIPPNTGAIIPLEDVEYANNNKIKVLSIKKQWQNIRKEGEEFTKHQLLLKKNTRLTPKVIALLLQAGVFEVFVYKKPKILLLSTGNELIPFTEELTEEEIQEGKIIDTNSYLLKTFLDQLGIEVIHYSGIKDQKGNVQKLLEQYFPHVDMIIITGGVSVGPYDFVKEDVKSSGFQEIFWKIKQKPGKPFFLAKKQNVLLFGLPGNPVSSFINFSHYILPCIDYFDTGEWKYTSIKVKSKETITNSSDRDVMYTIQVQESYFEITKSQGSHKISSIAWSDGYIYVPAGKTIQKNEIYECYLWRI